MDIGKPTKIYQNVNKFSLNCGNFDVFFFAGFSNHFLRYLFLKKKNIINRNHLDKLINLVKLINFKKN